MKRFVLAFALAICPALAFGQQAVTTHPLQVGTIHVDGTIAVTDAFQTVIPSALNAPPNKKRVGCLIQNNGTATMYVYVGPKASGDKLKSFTLIPPATGVQGGSFSCATGSGATVQDEISITGTGTDVFVAQWQ